MHAVCAMLAVVCRWKVWPHSFWRLNSILLALGVRCYLQQRPARLWASHHKRRRKSSARPEEGLRNANFISFVDSTCPFSRHAIRCRVFSGCFASTGGRRAKVVEMASNLKERTPWFIELLGVTSRNHSYEVCHLSVPPCLHTCTMSFVLAFSLGEKKKLTDGLTDGKIAQLHA
jgi:hypothetical protein